MKFCHLLVPLLSAPPALAQQLAAREAVEHVVVYGVLPDTDLTQSVDKVPGTVQSLDATQLIEQQGSTVLDALGTQVAGVSLTDTQGNAMVQDLRLHGFAASPLQGTPQGVAVYQNGVRLNEAFGDTVNWDAIPQTAVARLDVWTANPVFGLNALGGSVNMVMKNGFAWRGMQTSAQGGSYGHGMAVTQYGAQDGDFSFYGAAEGVTDEGWRYHSQSNIGRLYTDAGWRVGDSELHLVATGSASGLGVIGPTPYNLTQRDARSVYTYPQTTQNTIGSLALNGKTRLDDNWQVEGSVYVRTLRQRHVDGNDGDFERCSNSSSFVGKLCLQDDDFPAPSPKTLAFRNQFAIFDQGNNSIAYTAGSIYGTIDRTFTDTTTQGATLQLTAKPALFGLSNYFAGGASFDGSSIGFRSASTLGRIFPNLDVATDPALAGSGSIIHTNGNLGYAAVSLGATTVYYGLYAIDGLDLTQALTVTLGFRMNVADITTRDRSGLATELNGDHGYGHVNPLAGLIYKLDYNVTLFGGYSEANRAPTPLELDCASQTLPCLLEGSLVADPPLAQVVSHSYEVGARGKTMGFDWNISFFDIESDNDIVALASAIQGRGYFTNVPNTQRRGVDLSARRAGDGWYAYGSYSFLDATYQFTGTLASPNNPAADGNGNVLVTPGRHIPLDPANSLRLGGDIDVSYGISLGAEMAFTGSQYFDGDPSNRNAKLPSTAVINVRGSWHIDARWQLFAVIDNLLDNRDAVYGTYFDPSDTAGLITPILTDPRTITLRQPISLQAGFKLNL